MIMTNEIDTLHEILKLAYKMNICDVKIYCDVGHKGCRAEFYYKDRPDIYYVFSVNIPYQLIGDKRLIPYMEDMTKEQLKKHIGLMTGI